LVDDEVFAQDLQHSAETGSCLRIAD
jgi:hypothetical protein